MAENGLQKTLHAELLDAIPLLHGDEGEMADGVAEQIETSLLLLGIQFLYS